MSTACEVQVSTREGTKLGFVFDQVDDRGCMISELGAGALRRFNEANPSEDGRRKRRISGGVVGRTSLRPHHKASRRRGQQSHCRDSLEALKIEFMSSQEHFE